MKKLVALLLAVIMVVTMFAACNTNPTPNPTDASTPSTTDTPTTAAPTTPASEVKNADRYPLESTKTYTIANRMTDPANRELFQKWNEITGVDVDWVEMSGDTLSTAVTGGDMPDAMCITWGMDKTTIYDYGKAGKLVNFMDYLDYMPNFTAMLEEYPHAVDNFINADGTMYSLPGQAAGYGTPANLLYVRMDMAAEAGWEELPKTLDEFKQFLLDLQETYSDVEGFTALNFLMGGEWGYIEWNGYMDNFFFPSFGNEAVQTGYDLVDGKIVLGCATEQYKKYVQYINELYTSGACEQDIFSADCTAANKAKTAQDLVAVSPDSKVTTDNFASGKVELQLLAPLTSEWQSEQIWTNSTIGAWQLNCINGELPEEDIITLVQWFDAFYATSEDPLNEEGTINGNYLYLGEEGVDYSVDEAAGTYARLTKGEYESTTDWISNEGCSTALYVSAFPYIEYAESKFTRKQEGVRDYLYPHMIERFQATTLFLEEDEIDEVNDVNTELNLYMESAFAKFIVGDWTVEDNWDEYIDGLESIGALDLVDTYQAAYDRNN